VVGVNRASQYQSVEGAKRLRSEWKITPTTGRGSTLHPSQEAAKTIKTLRDRIFDAFDEFLILEFEASNQPPFEFAWTRPDVTRGDYAAALTRIARNYASRFGD